MPKVPRKRTNTAPAVVNDDPRGRVDILLLRLGEMGTRWLERKLDGGAGVKVNLWDGSDGVRAAVEQFCDAKGLTGVRMSPLDLARRAGLLARKRVKGAGR